jgi:hypothetical protein
MEALFLFASLLQRQYREPLTLAFEFFCDADGPRADHTNIAREIVPRKGGQDHL